MIIWFSALSRPLKVYQAYRHIKAWFTITLFSNQTLFHSGFFIGFNMYLSNLIILAYTYNQTSLLAWLIKKNVSVYSGWYLLTWLSKLSTVTTLDLYLPTKATLLARSSLVVFWNHGTWNWLHTQAFIMPLHFRTGSVSTAVEKEKQAVVLYLEMIYIGSFSLCPALWSSYY
jgi:hypothetical protein